MDWVMTIIGVGVVGLSYALGRYMGDKLIGQVKEDNERLNAELHKLTDRDERGRFKGGK